MKLADFLAEEQITHAEFGRRIETTQAAVSRYSNGSRIPRPAIMARIQAVTEGRVTPNDFLSLAIDPAPANGHSVSAASRSLSPQA